MKPIKNNSIRNDTKQTLLPQLYQLNNGAKGIICNRNSIAKQTAKYKIQLGVCNMGRILPSCRVRGGCGTMMEKRRPQP